MKFFVAGVTPAWSTSFIVTPANPKMGVKWLVMASLSGNNLDIAITGEAGMRHLQFCNVDSDNLAGLRKLRAEYLAQHARSTCYPPLLDFDFFFEKAAANIKQLAAAGLVSQDITQDLQDHLDNCQEILSPTTFANHVREQGHADILDNAYRYTTHPGEISFWADYWSIIMGKIINKTLKMP
ncbi:hypothetical protein [Pseudomonas sp. Leaf58]|uniref:hypothetical protein n=1 Tax=unclassified Pseudomonas TaxID=196821 RepID=UPI000A799BE3|nr:hypothetical protein [Pseudomonas sp. Leaf58]